MSTLLERYESKVKTCKRKRVELLQKAENDTTLQVILRQKCARDVNFFANYFVLGEDPRLETPRFPFILFERQEEFFRWINNLRKSTFVDGKKKTQIGAAVKSRDTGASVMVSIFLAQCFLFENNFSGAIGSRKAELVYNDGNPDALFSKVEMVLDNLPKWLSTGYFKKRNLLVNKNNGSTIKGEAGDNIGRGGRSSIYFIDEAPFIERSHKVISAVSRNTDCLILFGTPNGRDNEFARMYLKNKVSTFKIHWTDDPRRDEEWYLEQCELFDETTIAQELDCDFDAGKEGVLINGKWASAAVDFLNETNYEYQITKSQPIIAGYDPSGEGKDRSFLVIRQGIRVIYMQSWRKEAPEQVIEICHAFNVNQLIIDAGYGQAILAILKMQKQDIKFNYTPINFGGKPSQHVWTMEERSSRDKFINARAEMFWFLRQRFRKTYEMRLKIREWDIDDCIDLVKPNPYLSHDREYNRSSLPVCYQSKNLDIVLSQAPILTWEYRDNGKIQLISKKKLEESPDGMDAIALAFYNVGKAKKPNWKYY